MAAHGWQKLTAMTPGGFADGMLSGRGVPAPGFMVWVVTLLELLGGIALVLGPGRLALDNVLGLDETDPQRA